MGRNIQKTTISNVIAWRYMRLWHRMKNNTLHLFRTQKFQERLELTDSHLLMDI
jgi:hypothetical protein